jgi:hypothetical protein
MRHEALRWPVRVIGTKTWKGLFFFGKKLDRKDVREERHPDARNPSSGTRGKWHRPDHGVTVRICLLPKPTKTERFYLHRCERELPIEDSGTLLRVF